MFVKLNLKNNLIAGLVLSGSVAVSMAAASLSKSGTEYPILPSLPLDQVLPHLAVGPSGGYLVSQDTVVDGNGLGIRARRLNADLSAAASTFAVNSITPGDQQNAKAATLPNGGAVFVWQGSTGRGNKIFARFMGANQQFLAAEFGAADRAFGHQSHPAVAVLNDGTAVVVWAELNRDNSMSGVFAQRFTGTGERIGSTFMVNTVTYLNQRAPVIAALENGGFVIAWVSDEFRQRNSEYVDIAARLFDAQGNPLGNDFALNSLEEICANPAIVATPGGFRAAWSSRTITTPVHQGTQNVGGIETDVVVTTRPRSPQFWDVSSRAFDLNGQPLATEVVVNTERRGDQYSPRLASFGSKALVLWTSYGQDRSDEGIYGRVALSPTAFDGDEFLVNTRTRMKQLYPTVAVQGERVLVAWASFLSVSGGFDVVAQQYSIAPEQSLTKPANPFVFALGQTEILVNWAEIGGQPIAGYRLHVDDEAEPVESLSGSLRISRSGWLPGSVHTVRVSYRLSDGRTSPLSDPVTVTTWDADSNGDGLPDGWQRENWGKEINWPAVSLDSDGDGASNLSEFLAGTDPTSASSVLKVEISPREQGLYLQWPTAPGSYYQLQVTSDFNAWTNLGAARFAPSTGDAVPAAGPGQNQYYRVIRMR